jgi:hypothetical protein
MAVPALIASNAIPRYLDSIRKAGVPAKVDATYLKSIGFKNSNDLALIPLFRALGFLDPGGQPTTIYREYRGANAEGAKRVLGQAVRTCYAGLFDVYPDAHRKDDEALTNWLRANTDKGEATQARALRTFKALRDAASFDEAALVSADIPPNDSVVVNGGTPNGAGALQHVRSHTAPDVTINITLQVAATNDASIYDKFFASMKRHLFPDES